MNRRCHATARGNLCAGSDGCRNDHHGLAAIPLIRSRSDTNGALAVSMGNTSGDASGVKVRKGGGTRSAKASSNWA